MIVEQLNDMPAVMLLIATSSCNAAGTSVASESASTPRMAISSSSWCVIQQLQRLQS